MQPQQRQLLTLLQKPKRKQKQKLEQKQLLKLNAKQLLKLNKSVLQRNKLKQSKKQKLRLKRKLRLSAKQLLRLNKSVLQQNKLKQNKKQRLKPRRRLRLRPKQKLEQKLKRSKPKSLNYLNPILMSATRHLQKVLLQRVKRIYFHSQLIHHYKLIHLQRLPSPLTSIITSQ